MGLPATWDLTGARFGIYRGDSWGPHAFTVGREVHDAVTTNGGTGLTSASAAFATGTDAGATITSYDVDSAGNRTANAVIPAGATISSVTNGTTVVMSAAATAAATRLVVAIGARNLTGYTFLAQIRKSAQATDILATFAVVATVAAKGQLTIALTPADTAALAAGSFVWDLQSTSSGGVVETWVAGAVTVVGDVSRVGA